MALVGPECKLPDHAKGIATGGRKEHTLARRSIIDAAKVVAVTVVLGPPLGGIVTMGLLQIVPWMATGFETPLPEFGMSLLGVVLVTIPFSYFVGAHAAILGGLALAAYIAWGGRLTWWACLAASSVYPAALAVGGWFATRQSPETYAPVLPHAGMMAIASASAALLIYLLLRRTALVRRLNAPAET